MQSIRRYSGKLNTKLVNHILMLSSFSIGIYLSRGHRLLSSQSSSKWLHCEHHKSVRNDLEPSIHWNSIAKSSESKSKSTAATVHRDRNGGFTFVSELYAVGTSIGGLSIDLPGCSHGGNGGNGVIYTFPTTTIRGPLSAPAPFVPWTIGRIDPLLPWISEIKMPENKIGKVEKRALEIIRIRRKKMKKHKRLKRLRRDEFHLRKRQIEKKALSERLFREAMKSVSLSLFVN